jgi:LacI family transcriptional regulator
MFWDFRVGVEFRRVAAGSRGISADGSRRVLWAPGWYYPEMHRGVARFARERQWRVIADFDDPVPGSWQGDGALTLVGSHLDLWRRLRRLRVPVVDLAESHPEIRIPRVTMDNRVIGTLAADYFLTRSARRCRSLVVVDRWNLGVSSRRREAFLAACTAAGIEAASLSWRREHPALPDTSGMRRRWLMRRLAGLARPVGIFAVRDHEAAEVIEACQASGMAIPDDAVILGVDNDEFIGDTVGVPLASIDPNLEEVGYQGAALLGRLLDGATPPADTIYVPPIGIVERGGGPAVAVTHAPVARALKFMHQHHAEAIDMRDLQRHVQLSRSGLEKAFRKHVGRPPMDELRRYRLDVAKRLLVETRESVARVAARAGFVNAHNLCRVFRQHLGVTPGEFRSQPRSRWTK